jgi:hypothetical protein
LENHKHHVPLAEIMDNGITAFTKSNYRYSNGGKVKLQITEKLKPIDIPKWVDFKTLSVLIWINFFSTVFCFPVFTED